MTLNIILLVVLLLLALWTVMTVRLIRSVIGLAVTSAALGLIMFNLDAPLAAVFELSVCAGLIPVIFITTVSFTHRITQEGLSARKKERLEKFWFLPVLILIAGIVLSRMTLKIFFPIAEPEAETNVRNVLWNLRHLDLLGQIIILLAGAFGVVVFFKGTKK